MKIIRLVAVMAATAGLMISQAPLASEVTYREHIAPIFEQQCAACHGVESPTLGAFKENSDYYESQNIGPQMAGYAKLTSFVVWPETGALMRRLDDGSYSGGAPGNMYQYLGATDEERQENFATIKAWIGGDDAWYLNRWNARGDVPAVTKEQIDSLAVKY